MPVGVGTYFPNGKFAFPRSYLSQFILGINTPVTQDGRTFTFVDGFGTSIYTIRFKAEFWDWSSNRYTLDWIIEDAYYQSYPIPGAPVTFPFYFAYYFAPTDDLPSVIFLPYGVDFPTRFFYPLPPPPPDYWNPAPT